MAIARNSLSRSSIRGYNTTRRRSSLIGSYEEALGQLKKDAARKRQLCRENGVHLIAIPYTVELDDVPAYIDAEEKNMNLPVRIKRPDTINVAQFVLPELLRAMQAFAKAHDGGECLSTAYVNKHTKQRWRCAEGHEWETTPDSVKGGSWCRRPRDVQGHAAGCSTSHCPTW